VPEEEEAIPAARSGVSEELYLLSCTFWGWQGGAEAYLEGGRNEKEG
jgi:hypothetical protein